jgi:hypothetical protein
VIHLGYSGRNTAPQYEIADFLTPAICRQLGVHCALIPDHLALRNLGPLSDPPEQPSMVAAAMPMMALRMLSAVKIIPVSCYLFLANVFENQCEVVILRNHHLPSMLHC